MEKIVGVVAAGGSSGGPTSGGSVSTVEEEEEEEEVMVMVEEQQESNDMGMPFVEVSPYPDGTELELDLGLGLGGGACLNFKKGGGVGKQQVPRILTAKDLPSKVSRPLAASSPSSSASSSSSGVRADNNHKNANLFSAGTKRTADSVTSPPAVSQVVGWPPIRSYRMNSLANQAKSVATGELSSTTDKSKGNGAVYSHGARSRDKSDAHPMQRGHLRGTLFVKVTMDGIGIGRKVDLSAHSGYESMALTLEDMFTIPNKIFDTLKSNGEVSSVSLRAMRVPKLLDGSSDYVLTYEDKDGDWMLVGDVPWGMFLSSVKRLRIMKRFEAKGLAPTSEEWCAKQRSRPL
ncbi:hypothetical protein Dimus_016397 [Dionaea muscipula]